MADYPSELSPALAYVLGMGPGEAITLVRAMREVGFEIKHRYEDENAAVRHYLIPFVLEHGDDWRDYAIADLQLRLARRTL
jgi:hypothetical protein